MESKIQEKNWSVEIEKNISKIWEKESLYDFNIDDTLILWNMQFVNPPLSFEFKIGV